jgi:hypothetical protein
MIDAVLPAGGTVGVVAAKRLALVQSADGTIAARHSLEAGGETLPPVSLDNAWIVGTRAGSLSSVGMAAATDPPSAEARVETRWSAAIGEPILEMRAASPCLVLRSQAGELLGFDPSTREVRWRQKLLPGLPWTTSAGELHTYQAGQLKIYDACSGSLVSAHKAEAPPLAMSRRDTARAWIDANGKLHRSGVTPDAEFVQWEVGVWPTQAVSADVGFVIKTAAGEVGVIELTGW